MLNPNSYKDMHALHDYEEDMRWQLEQELSNELFKPIKELIKEVEDDTGK